MNTKYFAILFFIAFAAASELLDPFREIRETCLKRIHWTKEQLANAKNHPERLGNYLVCAAKTAGVLDDKTGLVDANSVVNLSSSVVPASISRLIIPCCTQEVIKSGLKSLRKVLILYYKCVVSKTPDVIVNLSGVLQEPVYPYTDTCPGDH